MQIETAAPRPWTAGVITRSRILLLGICLLPMLAYLPLLDGVLDPDEGVYGTIARGLLDGDVPYTDYFDHKPPLIYVWYAISLTLFGDTQESPRLMASIVWSVTTLLVYLQARRVLRQQHDAMVAALLFAASSFLVFFYPVANTEVFMALPLMGTVLAFTMAQRTGGHLGLYLLAGVLGGLAILTKPVAAWTMLALLVYMATMPKSPGYWKDIRHATTGLALGAGLVLLLGALPFVALGAFDDFFYANVTYNLGYSSGLSATDRLEWLVAGVRILIPGGGPFVLATLVALASKQARQAFLDFKLPVLLLLASALSVLTSGYIFGHYFVAMFPFMAILGAAVVSRWRAFLALPRYGSNVGTVRRLAAMLVTVGVRYGLTAGLVIGMGINNANMIAPILRSDENSFHRLSAYIEDNSTTSDPVYVYGIGSQVYFLSDRQPASRYMYNQPFVKDPRALEEAIEELTHSRPVFIADVSLDQPDTTLVAPMNEKFRAFLSEYYEFVGSIEVASENDIFLYRLRAID